jgi:hypothetical protein
LGKWVLSHYKTDTLEHHPYPFDYFSSHRQAKAQDSVEASDFKVPLVLILVNLEAVA